MRQPAIALTIVTALALAGCGSQQSPDDTKPASQGTTTEATEAAEAPEPQEFTQEDVASLAAATNDDEIEGATVKRIVGQVFNVQRDGQGVAVQVYTDPRNSDGSMVLLMEAGARVRDGDYVQVSGTVYDIFEGENAFGTPLTMPRIDVSDWKEVSASALDPAVKTYKRKQTQDAGGVQITVQRVEISDNETRIKVRYVNQSSEDFMETPSLVADGEEVESAYSDGNKEPASSVSPGASTSGTLTFEPVDPDARLELTYEYYDYDYNELSSVFTFGG